jgi:hypothetical protein
MGVFGRLWNWIVRGQVQELEKVTRREFLFRNSFLDKRD